MPAARAIASIETWSCGVRLSSSRPSPTSCSRRASGGPGAWSWSVVTGAPPYAQLTARSTRRYPRAPLADRPVDADRLRGTVRVRMLSRLAAPAALSCALLAALVASPAASAAALPGAHMSAVQTVPEASYPGMQRMTYLYGPVKISPGQNTIEAQPNTSSRRSRATSRASSPTSSTRRPTRRAATTRRASTSSTCTTACGWWRATTRCTRRSRPARRRRSSSNRRATATSTARPTAGS